MNFDENSFWNEFYRLKVERMIMKTAYDCWKDEQASRPIITLCKDFDDAIGGGIRVGAITELIGGPGAGKTQFW